MIKDVAHLPETAGAAHWLTERIAAFDRYVVSSVVPGGYEAYVRISSALRALASRHAVLPALRGDQEAGEPMVGPFLQCLVAIEPLTSRQRRGRWAGLNGGRPDTSGYVPGEYSKEGNAKSIYAAAGEPSLVGENDDPVVLFGGEVGTVAADECTTPTPGAIRSAAAARATTAAFQAGLRRAVRGDIRVRPPIWALRPRRGVCKYYAHFRRGGRVATDQVGPRRRGARALHRTLLTRAHSLHSGL